MTMMKRLVPALLAAVAGLCACADLDDPTFDPEGTEGIEERQSALQSNWPWPLPGTLNRDWVINS